MQSPSLTLDQLRAIMPYAGKRAETYLDPLNRAMAEYKIDTADRQAAFLAQVAHESGSLRYVRELASGEAYDTGRLAERLGNTPEADGDGQKFKGHGLIQITGRFNHARVRDRLRKRFPETPDFVENPEALSIPQWAALSAADYWDEHNLNARADRGEFVRITRIINGGTNGLADRLAYYDRAKRVLA